jgi:predicted acetyltransferase
MLELYQHDLSDLWDQDVDSEGRFGYALDRYLQRDASWPYVFRVGGHAAGFALVDTRVRLPGGQYWMDQFFVMKKYRSRGIGAACAAQVMRRHPGAWQVGQMPGNDRARAFWLRVVDQAAPGRYTETRLTSGPWQGTIQSLQVGDGSAR